MFGTITGFLLKNANPIAYAFLALIIVGGAWKIYDGIKEQGRQEIVVQMMQQNINALAEANRMKDKVIAVQEQNAALGDEIVGARDAALAELKLKLGGIDTTKLGDDIGDLAPSSLRELIRVMGTK